MILSSSVLLFSRWRKIILLLVVAAASCFLPFLSKGREDVCVIRKNSLSFERREIEFVFRERKSHYVERKMSLRSSSVWRSSSRHAVCVLYVYAVVGVWFSPWKRKENECSWPSLQYHFLFLLSIGWGQEWRIRLITLSCVSLDVDLLVTRSRWETCGQVKG